MLFRSTSDLAELEIEAESYYLAITVRVVREDWSLVLASDKAHGSFVSADDIKEDHEQAVGVVRCTGAGEIDVESRLAGPLQDKAVVGPHAARSDCDGGRPVRDRFRERKPDWSFHRAHAALNVEG